MIGYSSPNFPIHLEGLLSLSETTALPKASGAVMDKLIIYEQGRLLRVPCLLVYCFIDFP